MPEAAAAKTRRGGGGYRGFCCGNAKGGRGGYQRLRRCQGWVDGLGRIPEAAAMPRRGAGGYQRRRWR
eukprot:2595737-Rhodomonas_salina.1